ncbi:MAG: MBL fold metallo-hydrolase [Acidothermus sp.]|nr:MBL fold metallo-hydrolase [Acidothermus sp.]MCL6538132.1 hypothetical protein [Acidothermus sp.]
MRRVRFLNGVRTVGGVQFVVQDGPCGLVCDVGVVGNPAIVRREALFNPLLPPRSDLVLMDYLRAGMAPLVEGLYDPALLTDSISGLTAPLRRPGRLLEDHPLVDDVDPNQLAVFVSHLHEDHMQLLPFLAPGLPVFVSPPTARFHAALVAAGVLPSTRARLIPLAPGSVERFGGLQIEVVPVDHDVPGSAGVLVTTRGGRLAYTGDWRLHGCHPEEVTGFAARCRGVDVLVTEASTAVAPDAPATALPNLTERELVERFADLVVEAEAGVYCSFHERNLERQAAIRRAARAAGRVLVLSRRTYAIWHAAAEQGFEDLALGPDVAVWATDGDPAADRYQVPSDAPIVTSRQVAADAAAFVCEIRRYDRPLLLELGAGHDDLYVYLNGYPHGPADPGWEVLMTWVRRLGLRFVGLSSHGHALPDALRWLVEEIRPAVVVPVHTNAPECFPPVTVPVCPVRRGEALPLQVSAGAEVGS